MARYGNLETAAPLCRHALERTLATQAGAFGAEAFADMIRSVYAPLYAPDATCACPSTTPDSDSSPATDIDKP